jgi:acyl transferase domain-containing protein/NAD(P)H-dependent flavin oxidoreductase YrpB (nitropropane dioxygenase family)
MAVRSDLIWVETPFGEPAPSVVVAAARQGALGILDLGGDVRRAREALFEVTGRDVAELGVRVGARCPLGPDDLPDAVRTVVVAEPGLVDRWRTGRPWRVVAEVRSRDEARDALAAGVDGLVARGAESGGRVEHTGTFVLLQQVLDLLDDATLVPVWAQGGIGPHTAAAAVAGGATGVVVDAQTALLREVRLPRPVRRAVAAMDGSETRVVAGHRIYTRPDLWVADLDLPPDPTLPPYEAATSSPQRSRVATSPDELAARLGARSLEEQALPAGQDAALAAGFAERYRSVGGMVVGLRRAVAEHLDAARRAAPLAPGGPLAAATLGTRYPVAQGPMTRVSDRAPFAAAVAEGGGLPFLALALLPGDEVRPLLEETAARLGDRPWGVGVLGFVPKELRDEQLAVVRDVRPPLALVAGGRPAHAQQLEEVGIKTFLHVPAPGLLERFLRDGARRFVFEGFECGGHVGPRSSFALWEAQVDVLLGWAAASEGEDGAGELDVLFAGGIHDARSAAMVAAAAGPLAAAGARVGVLMGTAYLFTDAAVAAGAIGEEFQDQALGCERTALLVSGPGHATRCAESPFVDTFESTRRRLVSEGADHHVQWAELESLNLGRLRLASKGLRRDGDELVAVDRDEQRREGMFMIGDVATLRDRRTTVAALHEAVTGEATRWLDRAARDHEVELLDAEPSRPRPEPTDVAVVGMACAMPGAVDLDEFWANVVGGVNAIVEVPRERWDADAYFDPDWDHQTAAQRTGSASRWGGFLPEIPFDPFAYGIPPASLGAVEPSQLLALKVAADALADAGYDPGSEGGRPFDRSRTSVVFGAEGGTDQSAGLGFRALYPTMLGDLPAELDAWLPRVTEDTFPGLLTNVIAGRIANRLDLGGRNMTVDAACASSLAALDVACTELVTGVSDTVLCGGVDLHNGVQDYLLFTSVHALSPTGQCRTFDADADGIALGEGVACVVLKRLTDAERDGDRIYAVIRGVGASSDGRSLGLTAPRAQGQQLALGRAYEQARLDPSRLGLVEAHGTGTVVGDRTELATLTEVLHDAGTPAGSCVLGSVKSNVGHTKCAAGLAGLIKAAKSVYHGVRPPTLNVARPNPGWDRDTSPFAFLDTARPWADGERLAGVSAFGFGGTNFHVVLESHRDTAVPEVAVDAWPGELLVLRGDEATVDRALDDLAARLAEPVPAGQVRARPRDVAAAVNQAAGRGPVALAIVAEGTGSGGDAVGDDLADLRAKVAAARERRPVPGVYRPPSAPDVADPPTVAFLFPGQGSQRPGMAGDLFVHFGETHGLLRRGSRWAGLMLPPATFDAEAREAQVQALTHTHVAQPALGLADLGVVTVLARFGVRPHLVGGHSYGELVALCVAGAFDEATLLDLSEARAAAILAAAPSSDPGGMAAVAAPRSRLDQLLAGLDVVVANDNHPEQLVVAGSSAAVDAAVTRLKEAGVAAKRLPVACAFHSPLVAGATGAFGERLAVTAVDEPTLPVFANATAAPYPSDPAGVRAQLAEQLARPVRFTEQVEAMYEAGARVFVEAGPGRVLTGCVERTLGDRPHVAVAVDRPGGHGVTGLLHALAQLAVAGVPVDVGALADGRAVDPARWTAAGDARTHWTVNGHLVRDPEGQVAAGGLRPADTVPAIELAPAAASGAGAGAGVGGNGTNGHGPGAPAEQVDAVLTEYFRAAQQIIGAGHELMLKYLGHEPVTPGGAFAAPLAAPVPPAAGGNGNGSSSSSGVADRAGGGTAGVDGRNGAHAPPATGAVGTIGTAGSRADGAGGSGGGGGSGLPESGDLLVRLTAIVSARTGYPEEMLGPDLDVEADLSIDSIKRLEILAELADEIGLSDEGSLDEMELLVEQLAARKTLRGIVDFLVEEVSAAAGVGGAPPTNGDAPVNGHGPAVPATVGSPAPPETAAVGAGTGPATTATTPDGIPAPEPAATSTARATSAAKDAVTATNRFVVELAEAPAVPTDLVVPPDVGVVVVTGAGVRAQALAGELERRGVDVRRTARPDPLGDETVPWGKALVVVADLLDDPAPSIPELYGRVRPVLLDCAAPVLVVSGLGGGLGLDPVAPVGDDDVVPAGAGVRGLVKTIALELPDPSATAATARGRRVRLVDVDTGDDPAALAAVVVGELAQPDPPLEVGWRDGRRVTTRLVAAPESGAGGELALDRRSVVLVTGGARGVTAQVAVELVRRTGCRLELVGRSPLPDTAEAGEAREPDELAGCTTRAELRAALVAAGWRAPREIEAECDRVLARREVTATLAAVRAAGSEVAYHAVDVRDADALDRLVGSVYERHGRLDGVIHGAGALDDHFIRDKTPEAFAAVFATKVDAARTLLTAVRRAVADQGHRRPGFVALFGSTAGVCGNRGQADYAAANDALDCLAAAHQDAADRVVAVDWGPWTPEHGMVSDSLARIFEDSGMGLIEPHDGVPLLLAELAISAPAAPSPPAPPPGSSGVGGHGNGANATGGHGNGAAGRRGPAPPPAQVVAARCSLALLQGIAAR